MPIETRAAGGRSRIRYAVPAVLALLAAGMAWSFQAEEGKDVLTPSGVIYRDLCRIGASADAGRAAEAERGFTDEVHGPLHTLAADAQAMDRAAAGALLEAKQDVESAIEGRRELDFAPLIEATRRATAVVDRRDPGACR